MTVLLERDAEVSELRSALDGVVRGESRLVLVCGEAGVGKTTVLNAAVAAVPAGARLVRGRCDDIAAPAPLGPIREVARDWPWVLDQLTGGEMLDAYAAWVEELTREPTVVVIEDVHWADDATIDMLARLARRMSGLPLVVCVSFRDDEVHSTHPLVRFLGAVDSRRTVRLRLRALSRAGVALLCEGTGWEPEALYAATGGNPFYVTETVAVPPESDLPPTIAAAVLARVLRLSAPARAALGRLSVWPGVVDFASIDALLGTQVTALEEAERLGVIVTEPDGVRFRHEIARQATEASLPRLRRRTLQQDVTEVLRGRGDAHLARLVHHAQACGDIDTVVASAPRAAELAAQAGAHRQALTLFRVALDHPDRLAPEELARVLDGYAWELYNAHDFAAAVHYSHRAAEVFAQIGDRNGEAKALVRCARHLFMSADIQGALTVARRAARLTQDRVDPLTAQTATALGALLALVGDPAEAARELAEAHALGQRLGQDGPAALCWNYQALVQPGLSPADRIALLRRSLKAARAAGAHEVTARGYTNIVELLWRFGRYAEVADMTRRGLAYTTERGFASHAFNLEVHQALMQSRHGDWDAALRRLDPGPDPFDAADMLVVYNVPSYARLLARKGDAAAYALLERGWSIALRLRMLTGLAFAGPGLIEWAWLNDRPDVASATYAQWLPHRDRPCAGPIDAEMRRYLARCGVPVPEPARPDSGEDGWVLGLAGEWEAAAAYWREVGDPYEEALELAASGVAGPALRAWTLLADLGAEPVRAKLRSQLTALGVVAMPRGPRRRTQGNPAGLTDRQLEVVQLLAEGCTNAEIAQRLVLSVRTVDHHVSTALAKAGVRGRRELARLARGWR